MDHAQYGTQATARAHATSGLVLSISGHLLMVGQGRRGVLFLSCLPFADTSCIISVTLFGKIPRAWATGICPALFGAQHVHVQYACTRDTNLLTICMH